MEEAVARAEAVASEAEGARSLPMEQEAAGEAAK